MIHLFRCQLQMSSIHPSFNKISSSYTTWTYFIEQLTIFTAQVGFIQPENLLNFPRQLVNIPLLESLRRRKATDNFISTPTCQIKLWKIYFEESCEHVPCICYRQNPFLLSDNLCIKSSHKNILRLSPYSPYINAFVRYVHEPKPTLIVCSEIKVSIGHICC